MKFWFISHLRALICEVFKSLNNLNPEFMWSYFVFKNITCNIRKGPLLTLPAAKSTSYGINSVVFRACLLWNSLSQSVKHSESFVELKTKMKDLGNIGVSCVMSMNSIKNKFFFVHRCFLTDSKYPSLYQVGVKVNHSKI